MAVETSDAETFERWTLSPGRSTFKAPVDGNCVDNPTKPHTLDGVRDFITRKGDEPFCLGVALVEPHVPWVEQGVPLLICVLPVV